MVGTGGTRAEDGGEHANEPVAEDEAVTTVLAFVSDAAAELEAVRQRRSMESAAFAKVRRVP
ncbi:hypothetical protein ACIQV3_32690 [Streptomyces sp. NPDC099050]|uniref:hypothetical protein n=1 Tax=Streptomyces sp. NPDC099050 TaxID=3366100 RepID=UPI0038019D11